VWSAPGAGVPCWERLILLREGELVRGTTASCGTRRTGTGLPHPVVTLRPVRLCSHSGTHSLVPEHNMQVERTPAAGGGYSWYGRCSCGWRGHLRVSEQGAKHDAAAHRTDAAASRSRSRSG
jgi:hypothetical protein